MRDRKRVRMRENERERPKIFRNNEKDAERKQRE